MSKKAVLATLFLISYHFVSAQMAPAPQATPPPADAPYQKSPTVPSFQLRAADSVSYVTKDDLKKNHPTLIMYFSPDCEHCKHQTENILADFSKFKDIEIVMATYQPFDEMKDFIVHYKLTEHSNIKIGRDEKFFLAPFFRIRNLPYLALYDKKGDLITTFEGTQTASTILGGFDKKKG